MSISLRPWSGAVAALLFCFAGCDRVFEKSSKDELARGERKAATGDFRGAVAQYEAALDGTAATAEAHYRLALLYDGKLKSPRHSVHHLDRYLELAPSGPHARDAKNLRKENELKLALSSGKGTFTTQEEATRLKNEILRLNKQLVEVRAQKNAAPAPQSAAGKANDAVQKPIPPGTRTHVVQSGDTMASIARKYYKSSARWKDIQDANFYATNGTPKIKVGQTLIIP
ncbi:MAG: LysM domain/BON superfamily protein [Chthoniobacter sp.]|nr:LysM domain/BON superfamily protein [Chthoniobacter sp.]